MWLFLGMFMGCFFSQEITADDMTASNPQHPICIQDGIEFPERAKFWDSLTFDEALDLLFKSLLLDGLDNNCSCPHKLICFLHISLRSPNTGSGFLNELG